MARFAVKLLRKHIKEFLSDIAEAEKEILNLLKEIEKTCNNICK